MSNKSATAKDEAMAEFSPPKREPVDAADTAEIIYGSANPTTRKEGLQMAEFSVPVTPVTTPLYGGYGGSVHSTDPFCGGDVIAHQLNADVVKCGQDSILAKLDAIGHRDTLRETLHSQCQLEKSIADVRARIEASIAEQLRNRCETDKMVTAESQKTRDLVNAQFQRRDDQTIADLRLKLALATQCGCGCGCSQGCAPAAPGNGNGNS
jgi:hypothetical protein